MLAEHIAAVKLLIPTAVATLYDSQVPQPPTYPYNVLRSTGGTDESVSQADERSLFDTTVFITTVAETSGSVRTIQRSVHNALHGVRPVVDGRTCWKLRVSYTEPIGDDRDVTIPATNLHPVIGFVAWRLASVPA